MNWQAVVVWGLAATLVLTAIATAGRGMHLTRMDLPFILGTMLTPNRDRAKVIGALMHLVNGWIFASVYAVYFQALGQATWWLGLAMGMLHGTLVLVLLMPFLPGLHPRMVSDYAGPEPTRQLEPPGFLALNYGRRTPVGILFAHLVYGTILGAFYLVV